MKVCDTRKVREGIYWQASSIPSDWSPLSTLVVRRDDVREDLFGASPTLAIVVVQCRCHMHYRFFILNLMVDSVCAEAAVQRFGLNKAFEHDEHSGVSGSSKSARDVLRDYFGRRNSLRWMSCCYCNCCVLFLWLKVLFLGSTLSWIQKPQ